MAGSTFINIPPDVTNTENLKRFLNQLIEQIDVVFGNRGGEPKFTNNPQQPNISELTIASPPTEEDIKNIVSKVNEIINVLRSANIIGA